MKIFIGGLRDDANRYDIEDCFAKASQFERDFLIFVSHGSILSSLRNRIRCFFARLAPLSGFEFCQI